MVSFEMNGTSLLEKKQGKGIIFEQRPWTPVPAPDPDPGFTGVTTLYETINHGVCNGSIKHCGKM